MYKRCPKCKSETNDLSCRRCSKCNTLLSAEPAPGEFVGPFRILARLPEGDGGMATVYRAKVRGRDTEVALKIAHDKPDEYQALQKEAEALSSLRHPDVVRILPVPSKQGEKAFVHKEYIGGEPKCYVALEYVHGGSLRHRLNHGPPLTLPEILKIVRHVGSALSHAHSKGLVHLDVKPSNILLGEDGRVVLTDFGIVREEDTGRTDTSGRVFGTPGYMAPEHIRRRGVDHRSDVFSLGVVLYEMLTGTSPFKRGTTSATLHAVTGDQPESPSKLEHSLSKRMDDVLRKALAKDPDKRYQSVDDLVEAIEASARRGSGRLWYIMGALVGVLLVVLGVMYGPGLFNGNGITPMPQPTLVPTVVPTVIADTPVPDSITLTSTTPRPTKSTDVKEPTATIRAGETVKTEVPRDTATPDSVVIYTPECSNSQACISRISVNRAARNVTFEGTAAIPEHEFDYWKIEWWRAGSSDKSVPMIDGKQHRTRKTEELLLTWDVSDIPDGYYMVRLRVVDKSANYKECEAQIHILR